jgi:hypothetical protein
VALAAAEAAAVKENLATKAEQSRHRRMFGAPCTEAAQRFYAAFEIDEHGFPRNKAAAERMVAKVAGPLGSLSTDQQAAVLTAAIKRPALREAANRAGIGQASLGEHRGPTHICPPRLEMTLTITHIIACKFYSTCSCSSQLYVSTVRSPLVRLPAVRGQRTPR